MNNQLFNDQYRASSNQYPVNEHPGSRIKNQVPRIQDHKFNKVTHRKYQVVPGKNARIKAYLYMKPKNEYHDYKKSSIHLFCIDFFMFLYLSCSKNESG